MQETSLYKLKASTKKQGDLVTFKATDNGTLIVIIDKGNPNFLDAKAGEIWEVNVRTKEGESFALGDLIRKLEIEMSVEHLADGPTPVGLVIRDSHTKNTLGVINFSQGVYLKGKTIPFVKHIIKARRLEHFTEEILNECSKGMEWYNKQIDACEKAVEDAIILLKQGPRPVPYQEDFEIEPVHITIIRNELWKLVSPFRVPNAEDIADQVLVTMNCWYDEKVGFRKINFV
jgi:hypothetical protein